MVEFLTKNLLNVEILGFFFGWKLGVVVAHILSSSVGWQSSQSLPGFKLPPIDHGAATVMAPEEKRTTTTHWLTIANFTATVRPKAIFAGRDNFSGDLDHRGRGRVALIKSSLSNGAVPSTLTAIGTLVIFSPPR